MMHISKKQTQKHYPLIQAQMKQIPADLRVINKLIKKGSMEQL